MPFKAWQTEKLVAAFTENAFRSTAEIKALAGPMQLTASQVTSWFNNRRRLQRFKNQPPGTKRRRPRLRRTTLALNSEQQWMASNKFTKEEEKELLDIFERQPNPIGTELAQLAQRLQMSRERVRGWFYRRRKKMEAELDSNSNDNDEEMPNAKQLDEPSKVEVESMLVQVEPQQEDYDSDATEVEEGQEEVNSSSTNHVTMHQPSDVSIHSIALNKELNLEMEQTNPSNAELRAMYVELNTRLSAIEQIVEKLKLNSNEQMRMQYVNDPLSTSNTSPASQKMTQERITNVPSSNDASLSEHLEDQESNVLSNSNADSSKAIREDKEVSNSSINTEQQESSNPVMPQESATEHSNSDQPPVSVIVPNQNRIILDSNSTQHNLCNNSNVESRSGDILIIPNDLAEQKDNPEEDSNSYEIKLLYEHLPAEIGERFSKKIESGIMNQIVEQTTNSHSAIEPLVGNVQSEFEDDLYNDDDDDNMMDVPIIQGEHEVIDDEQLHLQEHSNELDSNPMMLMHQQPSTSTDFNLMGTSTFTSASRTSTLMDSIIFDDDDDFVNDDNVDVSMFTDFSLISNVLSMDHLMNDNLSTNTMTLSNLNPDGQGCYSEDVL